MALAKEENGNASDLADEAIGRAKGRKDSTGQEKKADSKVVQKHMEELVKLHIAAGRAAEKFSTKVLAVAEEAGMNTANVKKTVKAYAAPDSWHDKKRDAAQLSLLLSTIKAPDGAEPEDGDAE